MNQKIEEDEPNNQPPTATGNKDSDGEQRVASVIERGEAPPQRPPDQTRQQRPESCLYLLSQWALVVLTLGAICTAIRSLNTLQASVTAANRQADAAATQARTSQEEFQLSERPWVYAESIALVEPFNNVNGLNITLQFSLRNIGHSPAAATSVNLQAYLEGRSTKDLIADQKKVCDPIRLQPPDVHALGYTIFPGQQIVLQESVSIAKETLEANVQSFGKLLAGKHGHLLPIMPIITGCIDYRFEFAKGHHQTPFILQLFRLNPKMPEANFALGAMQPTSLKLLKLQQWFEAGADAD